MAEDFKLGIGLEEKAALAALVGLTKETQRFSRKASKSFGTLNIAVGSFIGHISSRAVSAGFARLNRGLLQTVSLTRDYSRGIAEINTLLPKNAKLTDDVKDAILDMSAQFGQDVSTQTKAFYQIVSAGITDTSKAMIFLSKSSQAAVGGLATVEQAADLVTSQFNVFGKTGETATTIFDKVFETVRLGKTTFGELAQNLGQVSPFAQSAGASFDEVAGSLAFLTKNGIRTDIAVRGLRQVFASVIKPSKEAVTTAKALGIAFDSTAIRGGKFADFLKDVAVKTKGNEKALAKLFGNIRALNPILAIVRGNFSDFQKILQQVKVASGSSADAFKVMEKSLDFQLTKAEKSMGRIAIITANQFVPAILKATVAFNQILGGITGSDIAKVLVGIGRSINQFIIMPFERAMTAIDQFPNIMKLAFLKIIHEVATATVNMMKRIPLFASLYGDDLDKTSDLLEKSFEKNKMIIQKKIKEGFDEISISGNIKKFFDNVDDTIKDRAFQAGANAASGFIKGTDDKGGDGTLPFSSVDPTGAALLQQEFDTTLAGLTDFDKLLMGGLEGTLTMGKAKFIEFAKETKKFAKKVKDTLQQGIAGGAASAFSAMGAAIVEGEDPLKAFANALLSTMGQMAVQLGSMFILQGIAYSWAGLPNGPGLIGAGIALSLIGGVLSAIGGGGAPTAGGEGGGVGAGGDGLTPEIGDDLAAPETVAQRGTEINVVVEGNVVDQEEFFVNMASGLRDALIKDGAVINIA